MKNKPRSSFISIVPCPLPLAMTAKSKRVQLEENSTVVWRHRRQLLVLLSVCLFSVSASARQAANWHLDEKSGARPSPPLTVAKTDELYKPVVLPDGRVMAVALPITGGVQQAVAIY